MREKFIEDHVIHITNMLPLSVIENRPIEPKSETMISMSIDSKKTSSFWIPVLKINLTAPFKVCDDGSAWPVFDGTLPIFEITWNTPPDMNLFLVVLLNQLHYEIATYLVAMEENKYQWRIPISNLYDDCKLCNGNYERKYGVVQALTAAWDQFNLSRWNRDLYASSSEVFREKTKKMFGFKSVNNTFEQVPMSVDWREYCEKINNEILLTHYPL